MSAGNRRRTAIRELAARGPGPQRGQGETPRPPGSARGSRRDPGHPAAPPSRPSTARVLSAACAAWPPVSTPPSVFIQPIAVSIPAIIAFSVPVRPRGHAHQHDQAGLESPRPGGPQWHPLGQMPPQRRRIGPQPGPACGEQQLPALFAPAGPWPGPIRAAAGPAPPGSPRRPGPPVLRPSSPTAALTSASGRCPASVSRIPSVPVRSSSQLYGGPSAPTPAHRAGPPGPAPRP